MASLPLQVLEMVGHHQMATIKCPKHGVRSVPGINLMKYECGNPCGTCSEVCLGRLNACCPWQSCRHAPWRSSWPDILCSKFMSVSSCVHGAVRLIVDALQQIDNGAAQLVLSVSTVCTVH